MRQAAPLAAASIVALENMIERLPEDHRTAKRLATALHKIDASNVDPALVETNRVRVSVRVSPCATWDLRFVTHRHIGAVEVDKALDAFADVWEGR